MPSTTTKGVPYPLGSDAAAELDTIVQSLAQWVDDNPGIASMTTTARNALTSAEEWVSRVIYNSTTSALERYNGAAWVSVADFTPYMQKGSSDISVQQHQALLLPTDERNLTMTHTAGVLTSVVEKDGSTTVKTTTLTYTDDLPTTVVEEVVTPEGTVTMTTALTYTAGLLTGRTRTLS
jgi:hypothetical protein